MFIPDIEALGEPETRALVKEALRSATYLPTIRQIKAIVDEVDLFR